MSKDSGVITLKPMKGSELAKEAVESPIVSKYVTPSRRPEAPKIITAEQLDSQVSFPSLGGTVMTKGVSWAQLRNRLNPSEPPVSMKASIETSLKRLETAEEEAHRIEQITDPFLMSDARREQEGWQMLNLKQRRKSWTIHEEPPSAWPNPVLSFSVNKMQSLLYRS